MVACKDLQVAIVINGQIVPEYADDEDGSGPTNVITKYIEATSGASFEVRANCMHRMKALCHAVSFVVNVDGRNIDAWITYPGSSSAIIDGCRSQTARGAWMTQRLRFASIELSKSFCSNGIR